jgi:hypothetical protein
MRHAAAIAGVYTPPSLRGRGYAGLVTAAVVERIFAEGKTAACLYTDLRNRRQTAAMPRSDSSRHAAPGIIREPEASSAYFKAAQVDRGPVHVRCWPSTSGRCDAAIFAEPEVDRTLGRHRENGAHDHCGRIYFRIKAAAIQLPSVRNASSFTNNFPHAGLSPAASVWSAHAPPGCFLRRAEMR